MKVFRLVVLAMVVGLIVTANQEVLCQRLRKGEARLHRGAEKPVDAKKTEEEYFEFWEQNLSRAEFKALKTNLETLKAKNPDAYRRRIGQSSRKIRHLKHMKEKDPERFKSQVEMLRQEGKCAKLTKEYRDAQTDEEKAKIRAELKQILDQLFDKKQGENEARVKQLEDQISKLKARNEERVKSKAEIVEKRLEQLTPEKNLEW